MYRKPGGYSIIVDPDMGTIEEDSFTCKHCQRVTFVPARCDPVELGGRCTCCDALICKHCVGKPCDHIEKKLERWEARGRLYEAMRDA
jgi:hypothetical protein